MRRSGAVIGIEAHRLEWQGAPGEPPLALSALGEGESLRSAEEVVFISDGWDSEEAASAAAAKYLPALLRTFARLRVGVDYGRRRPAAGGLTDEILESMGREHGVLALNEQNGMMVYPTDLPVVLAGASGSGSVFIVQEQFESVLAEATSSIEPLTPREVVALDLYNASFFQQLADTRLLLLVMAIEALLEPTTRSAPALAHVERLIDLTQESAIDDGDRASMLGSLRYLKKESIRQSGLKLVSRQLGDRKYADTDAAKFFDHCYGLRSSLTHGGCPLPEQGEVGRAAANLEVMVSDLLAGRLKDFNLAARSPG